MGADMSPLGRINRRLTQALPVKRVRSRLTRPVASITFDDFPRSAWTQGGPILARHGVRATYYVAGGLCGRVVEDLQQYDVDDLRAVHEAGHEIGCHGFSHRAAPELSGAELEGEAERNAAFLADAIPDLRPASFAYPYGEASVRTKVWHGRRYASSRGIRPGVNAGAIDLAQVESVPLEHRRWSPELIERWVHVAVRRTGWLTFFTHDVSDAPSPYGATPEMLDHALATLARAQIEVLPVKAAMARAVFGEG